MMRSSNLSSPRLERDCPTAVGEPSYVLSHWPFATLQCLGRDMTSKGLPGEWSVPLLSWASSFPLPSCCSCAGASTCQKRNREHLLTTDHEVFTGCICGSADQPLQDSMMPSCLADPRLKHCHRESWSCLHLVPVKERQLLET